MTTAPTVAVIHATAASLKPVEAAFTQTCPDVLVWQLLDDRLVRDADKAGGLTDELRDRMSSLIQYAIEGGADAVQLACSMYGPVATARTTSVPVLPSDEAMFDEVVRLHPDRVGVLASLLPAAADTVDRLTTHLRAAGCATLVEAEPVPAITAVTGDPDRVSTLLCAAAVGLAKRVDVIVLAQYSLAPFLDDIVDAVDLPVLSPPHLAADRLVAVLDEQARRS